MKICKLQIYCMNTHVTQADKVLLNSVTYVGQKVEVSLGEGEQIISKDTA